MLEAYRQMLLTTLVSLSLTLFLSLFIFSNSCYSGFVTVDKKFGIFIVKPGIPKLKPLLSHFWHFKDVVYWAKTLNAKSL